MARPKTVADLLAAIRDDQLVEPVRLAAFLERHSPVNTDSVLARLVSDGLLTAYQAAEVDEGRGSFLWLGSYRVLDRLGRGGMGQVYLAEHAVLGKKVAIKVLSDSLRADVNARKRFVREARAAATLNHPNIVHVFDVDMAHDPPYLVMEFVDGVSLQAAVARYGTFALGEAASVALQVADGLTQAAAIGLVHRDIKPANILVDRCGGVKILDLGIARFTQEDTHSRANGADVILGTLDYLAPEQAVNSSEVDTRADLYALGATLYFLLTGHPPFPGNDIGWKMTAKQKHDPHPLQQLRPDLPTEFTAIVHRLLARNPAGRYHSPAAVVAVMHEWAAPGENFPSRLFRLSSDTTAGDRRITEHEIPNNTLPDTLRILKPGLRKSGEKVSDKEGESTQATQVPACDSSATRDTDSIRAGDASSVCDLAVVEMPKNAPVPSAVRSSALEPRSGSRAKAQAKTATTLRPLAEYPPKSRAPRSVWPVLGLVTGVLALVAGIVVLVGVVGR